MKHTARKPIAGALSRAIPLAAMAASGLILAATAAKAADLDFPLRSTVHTPVEYGSGWYLRGDVGWVMHPEASLTYFSDARYAYDHQSTDGAFAYGAGFGFVFNNFMRADLTWDHSGDHQWSGTTQGTACGGGVPGDCYSEDEAQFDRDTFLANAYFSLGDFRGFKPYVGAGIGVSHVSWDRYQSAAHCIVDPGETCDYGAHSGVGTDPEIYEGPVTNYPTESGTALTYALMAGVDYRINQNWLVDVGYRYTHIDGGVVIREDALGAGSPQGDSRWHDINLHEVRVGLRYEIW